MRRSLGLASVLVALSLMFPLGASAGPPDGRFPPGTIFAVAPPGLICPAATGEVTWTIVDGQYFVVGKPGGRWMEGMGTARMKVASGATGKFIVLDIYRRGLWLPGWRRSARVPHLRKAALGVLPGDAGPGDRTSARTYYFVGTTTTLLAAADGTALEGPATGRIVLDVCAAISCSSAVSAPGPAPT